MRKRQDCFGIIDLLAIKPGIILGVQSTSWHARKKHLEKLRNVEVKNTRAWLEAGGRLQLITWKKVKRVRGGKAFTYMPCVEEVKLP